jgi:hypothetical protein
VPYLIRRPLMRRLASVAIATMSIAVAVPAVASACTPTTSGSSQPFTWAGDGNWYTLLPGSGFTSSYLPGWTLHNAYVQSAWGQSWLVVNPSGGYAITPPFCVSSITPNFRFWVRQANPSTWGQMNVAAIWSDPWGNHNVVINGQQLSTNWSLSMSYMLGTMLPTESGGTYMVQLEFEPNAYGGSPAQISGIYVDPYSRG